MSSSDIIPDSDTGASWTGHKQGDLQLSASSPSSPVLLGVNHLSSSQRAATDCRQLFVESRNTLRRDRIETNFLIALGTQPVGFVTSVKDFMFDVKFVSH